MLRAVLAVLVAVALLAASQPVIQQGRLEHAATQVEAEATDFVDSARGLVRAEDALSGAGARRIVTLDLPEGHRFEARTDHFEIRGGATPSLHWRLVGGGAHRRPIEGLTLSTPGEEPLTIDGGGQHRLLLSLRGSPGDPVVHVRRFDPAGGSHG